MSEEAWGNEGQAPVSEKKISDLQKIADDLIKFQEEYKTKKKAADESEEKYKECKAQLIKFLEESGLDKFSAVGKNFGLTPKKSISHPQGADKDALFNYLKTTGSDGLIKVDSRSLMSWLNKEVEVKEAKGVVGWLPPGIKLENIYSYNDLSITKG